MTANQDEFVLYDLRVEVQSPTRRCSRAGRDRPGLFDLSTHHRLLAARRGPPHAGPERQEIPVTFGESACRAEVAHLTKTFSRVKDGDFYWRLDCESHVEPKPKTTK